MSSIYAFLGGVAWLRRTLGQLAIQGIPLDIGLLVVAPLIALFALAVAVENESISAWLIAGVAIAIFLLFLQSVLRHDIVFEPEQSGSIPSINDPDVASEFPSFAASGRFSLWEGDKPRLQIALQRLMTGSRAIEWFIDVPASLEVQSNCLFAFITEQDKSRYFLNTRLVDRAGIWTADGTFESLSKPECGLLHFQLCRSIAIRIHFHDAVGIRRTVVLTFADDEQRANFLQAFRRAAGVHWPGIT